MEAAVEALLGHHQILEAAAMVMDSPAVPKSTKQLLADLVAHKDLFEAASKLRGAMRALFTLCYDGCGLRAALSAIPGVGTWIGDMGKAAAHALGDAGSDHEGAGQAAAGHEAARDEVHEEDEEMLKLLDANEKSRFLNFSSE